MTYIPTIDLFSGAGGLSLGLKQSRFEVVLAVEMNKHAAQTFKTNFKEAKVFQGDVKELSFKKYKGVVNLVAGGPPCQPFSVAGAQKSHKDPRYSQQSYPPKACRQRCREGRDVQNAI